MEIGTLTVNGMSYSAEGIATLRVRKVLLDEAPDQPDGIGRSLPLDTLAAHVRGVGTLVPDKRCALKAVSVAHRDKPEVALQFTLPADIFALKADMVDEQVLELTLGLVAGGRCAVTCRGRRRQKYSNVEPAVVEVRGECPLG